MSICVKCHGIVLALYGVSSINLYALYKIQSACLISCGLSIQEFLDTFIYRSVSFLIRLVIPVLLIVFVYKARCRMSGGTGLLFHGWQHLATCQLVHFHRVDSEGKSNANWRPVSYFKCLLLMSSLKIIVYICTKFTSSFLFV